MKRKLMCILILCLCFIPIRISRADSVTYRFTWSSGTIIDLTTAISSDELNDGSHTIYIEVTLVALNSEAVDVHDIEVDFKISGRFSSSVSLATISSVGGSSSTSSSFQYFKDWGTVNLELYLSCRENIPLAFDPELYADWTIFFTLSPAQTTTTPSTPTTPTNPNANTNGFDIAENWYIFVIIGVVIIAVSATAIIVSRGKKPTATSQVLIQQPPEKTITYLSNCSNCDAKLESFDSFCPTCGAKISRTIEY